VQEQTAESDCISGGEREFFNGSGIIRKAEEGSGIIWDMEKE
jgi:hypothetical protein